MKKTDIAEQANSLLDVRHVA